MLYICSRLNFILFSVLINYTGIPEKVCVCAISTLVILNFPPIHALSLFVILVPLACNQFRRGQLNPGRKMYNHFQGFIM